MVAERANQALAHSIVSVLVEPTAAPSSSSCQQVVATRRQEPVDDDVFEGGIECMTSEPIVEFTSKLATAVVKTTSDHLLSKGQTLQHMDALLVEAALDRMD